MGKWYESNAANVADAKQGHMHADGFDDILMEFATAFDCIKPLCRKLQNILFPFTEARRLDLGTSADPKTLYKPIIKAFKDGITG